jgi:hypothetical protein
MLNDGKTHKTEIGQRKSGNEAENTGDGGTASRIRPGKSILFELDSQCTSHEDTQHHNLLADRHLQLPDLATMISITPQTCLHYYYLDSWKEKNDDVQDEIDRSSGDHLRKDVQTIIMCLLDIAPPVAELGSAAENPNQFIKQSPANDEPDKEPSDLAKDGTSKDSPVEE